jgi:hypothetical protein
METKILLVVTLGTRDPLGHGMPWDTELCFRVLLETSSAISCCFL